MLRGERRTVDRMKEKRLKSDIAVEGNKEYVERDAALRLYHISDWPGISIYLPMLCSPYATLPD